MFLISDELLNEGDGMKAGLRDRVKCKTEKNRAKEGVSTFEDRKWRELGKEKIN